MLPSNSNGLTLTHMLKFSNTEVHPLAIKQAHLN